MESQFLLAGSAPTLPLPIDLDWIGDSAVGRALTVNTAKTSVLV